MMLQQSQQKRWDGRSSVKLNFYNGISPERLAKIQMSMLSAEYYLMNPNNSNH